MQTNSQPSLAHFYHTLDQFLINSQSSDDKKYSNTSPVWEDYDDAVVQEDANNMLILTYDDGDEDKEDDDEDEDEDAGN